MQPSLLEGLRLNLEGRMEGLMEMSDHLLSSTLSEYEIKAEYKSACLPVQGLLFFLRQQQFPLRLKAYIQGE